MNQLNQQFRKYHVIQDESQLELPQYIDRPDYVKRKSAGYGLMAAGWMLWMWLFMPLLTLLFWWLEGNTIYVQTIEYVRPQTSLSLMKLIFCISVLIGCLFIWASYNWVRFHGEDRRQPADDAQDEELAQGFSVSTHDIELMRNGKNIVLYYSGDGHLSHYDIQSLNPDAQHEDKPNSSLV